jgi:uncharacterized repeat protein (TIGR03803 family)
MTGERHSGGTIFELKPPRRGGSWQEKELYLFKGHPDDGVAPNGGLVFGSDGAIYGTTVGGGRNSGDGTVFKLTPGKQWKEALLYTFVDGADPHGDTPKARHAAFSS